MSPRTRTVLYLRTTVVALYLLTVPELGLAGIGKGAATTGNITYPVMAPVQQYLMAPAAEIALARSAGPKTIADKATVLTLSRSGYETAVKGSNGFVCLVGRSWQQKFVSSQFWNPKVRDPECWNPAAVSSELPEYLKLTQWALAGVSKEEIFARTKVAWASHEFGPPIPVSMFYMLSKDEYIQDHDPNEPSIPWPQWYPHLVFLLPATDAAAWGANVSGPGAQIFSDNLEEPITRFFVVVPYWSDGTLYPYPVHKKAH
jgi:hypothetical protein